MKYKELTESRYDEKIATDNEPDFIKCLHIKSNTFENSTYIENMYVNDDIMSSIFERIMHINKNKSDKYFN